MELGNKVTIGGRTMLRPGFSLVGLTGRIVASRFDAPPGTRAVWMDWEEWGYDDPDLPRVVNVPGAHLELADAASAAPANAGKESPLKAVKPAPFKEVAMEKPDAAESEEAEERPKLRLI